MAPQFPRMPAKVLDIATGHSRSAPTSTNESTRERPARRRHRRGRAARRSGTDKNGLACFFALLTFDCIS